MTAGVQLSDLVVGMARRGTPLASETGLFIALQATEALLEGPMRVTARDVHITPEGQVELGAGHAIGEQATVVSVAGLVDTVISPAPMGVRAMIDRARSGQIRTLPALRAEIESLLVPLNRSAARRVLGRLSRELRRMEQNGTAPASAKESPPEPREEPVLLHAESSALATAPCAPPVLELELPRTLATDTMPELDIAIRLDREIQAMRDAMDTDPDGDLRPSATRSTDEQVWYDVDVDVDADAESGEDDVDASDDYNDAIATTPLVSTPRGKSGRIMVTLTLLALAGAALAWHAATTSHSAASVLHGRTSAPR